jgi:predicted  nucleic acid-binding Zn-ribbon protein
LDGFPELLALSRLDATLNDLRELQSQIEPRRAVCAERRTATAAELEAAGAAVVEAEQEQRRHEGVAEDQQAILDKLESQQHQVKSNEAYTALLAEMAAAKDAISEAETLVLETMEGIETAKAAVAAAQERVDRTLREVEAEEQACDAQEKDLAGRIAALETERGERLAGLDRSVATRYDKVASRRTPAVVVVTRETCEGCSVGIPPQAFIEMLKGESLIVCGTCQRILIHQDKVPGA